MNYSTQTLIQAAMFAALGTLTKMSRSGNSIVFIRPVLGRSDLSGDDALALAQAQAAGLPVDSVTEAQVIAWQTWYADMREARRVGPEARFLITRKYSMQVGAHSLTPGNRVSLVDGWGEILCSAEIPCLEHWDSNAVNRLGRPGAAVSTPDYERITHWIERKRHEMPEFAHARVIDNNQEKHHG